MKPQNKPYEPIVTRRPGAKFYCLDCGKTYPKCKCRVYVSADTLKRDMPYARARRVALLERVKGVK